MHKIAITDDNNREIKQQIAQYFVQFVIAEELPVYSFSSEMPAEEIDELNATLLPSESQIRVSYHFSVRGDVRKVFPATGLGRSIVRRVRFPLE
jgi:hypothetical protein